MLQVTKEVLRKVLHPQTGEKVERKAQLSFQAVDITGPDWFDEAVEICGGNSELAARVWNNGIYVFLRQQTTNELGKADEVTRSMNRSIGALKMLPKYKVMKDEDVRKVLLSNPELAAAFVQVDFEPNITVDVTDFPAACTKIVDEKPVLRFPM